jgi:hypothetical protein
MTAQELDKLARELATMCDECDVGRASVEDFERVVDHALASLSPRETGELIVRIARLQGRDVAVISQGGEISASSDLAESAARGMTGRRHS